MDLDIFLMYLSVVFVFGNYFQINYVVVNVFEDSFFYYRVLLGFFIQIINWGVLVVGMGFNFDLKDIFYYKGMYFMIVEKICICFI